MHRETCGTPANNSVVSTRTRIGVSERTCLLPVGHEGFHVTRNEKGLLVAYEDDINCDCPKCADFDSDWICQKVYDIDQTSASLRIVAA